MMRDALPPAWQPCSYETSLQGGHALSTGSGPTRIHAGAPARAQLARSSARGQVRR
jgi:hypothetical protein